MADNPLVACEHCASLHRRVPLEAGALAACRRCGYALYRQSAVSLDGWIALTLAALVVFAIANAFPVARLDIQGHSVTASLPGALWLTWRQGHWVLAAMTGLFGFWLPLTQLFFLLWGLLCIRSGRLPWDFRYGMRMLHYVANWSMVPVLMLGFLVAMVKFSSLATLQPGPGIWGFAVLTFLLTGLSRVSALRLWRYAEDAGLSLVSGSALLPGQPVAACSSCGHVQSVPDDASRSPCARCGATVHLRKPNVSSRVWALLVAASIIYIPANVLPIMHIRSTLDNSSHTILGGVVELWRLGSWDLALIVFIASIVVPMTKLLALAILLLRRQWEGPTVQRQRTRLYELIEFIGQWSMLDVFVVIVMTALADFPGISQVIAGPGAVSFGVVVILTMLAAMSYDPRLGWDRPSNNTVLREPHVPQ
ncbi:MAG TPA: paraquat-inducible protein A [Candidimonas sp.]|nr:paraquat-inducible protein A [Candidimonas sp.]